MTSPQHFPCSKTSAPTPECVNLVPTFQNHMRMQCPCAAVAPFTMHACTHTQYLCRYIHSRRRCSCRCLSIRHSWRCYMSLYVHDTERQTCTRTRTGTRTHTRTSTYCMSRARKKFVHKAPACCLEILVTVTTTSQVTTMSQFRRHPHHLPRHSNARSETPTQRMQQRPPCRRESRR